MKERNRPRRGLTLRHYFTLLVMGEIVLTIGLSSALTEILEGAIGNLDVSPILFLAGFSLLIGAGCAIFVNRVMLTRIIQLSNSMKEVAKGDFSIRLDTRSIVKEISESHNSFNSMVTQLSKTETLQSSFISDVSHEFKTPINAIEGYVTLLQDETLAEEQRQEYIDKILLSTERLSHLVGNILLLSKVDHHTVALQKSRFSLDEQIRNSIVLLENKWEAKGIELCVDLCEVQICAYETFLSHIWTNLIDNAVKYSPVGGTVAITLKKTGDQCVFTVTDDGPGIDEEALPFIFNKFYQGDTSHKSEGNGLGLALVRRIVTLHGGSIVAENRPEGGASFTLTLPLSDEAPN